MVYWAKIEFVFEVTSSKSLVYEKVHTIAFHRFFSIARSLWGTGWNGPPEGSLACWYMKIWATISWSLVFKLLGSWSHVHIFMGQTDKFRYHDYIKNKLTVITFPMLTLRRTVWGRKPIWTRTHACMWKIKKEIPGLSLQVDNLLYLQFSSTDGGLIVRLLYKVSTENNEQLFYAWFIDIMRLRARVHQGKWYRNATAISENCYQPELNTCYWMELLKLRKLRCSTQADNNSRKLRLPVSLVCPRPKDYAAIAVSVFCNLKYRSSPCTLVPIYVTLPQSDCRWCKVMLTCCDWIPHKGKQFCC
jgi:hypothetical protein